jgi:Family of unknown function (DUF6623)
MSQRFDYWIHGVATVLQSPELAKLVQHRGDLGTVVEQDGNTSAWFHLPIPTPSVLEGDTTTNVRLFALVAKVNENARVSAIHIRRGKDLIFSKSYSLIGTTINQVFDIPDVSTSIGASSGAGIVICVKVEFLTGGPRGRVEFYGAGVMFS